jgi:phage shock protein E
MQLIRSFLAASAFVIAFACTAPKIDMPPSGPVTAIGARQLLRSGGGLIDVRTPEEYAQGHLPGAVNIPVDQLTMRLDKIPKDRPIILYCQSGKRSASALRILSSHGFRAVYDLGAMSHWSEDASL